MIVPAAEVMRPQDATFLYLEGPATPYHIASLIIAEGPPPAHADVIDVLGERVAFVPRLSQCIRDGPFARPRWVDDRHFDLAYHLRRASVPAPGNERQLLELTGRLLTQHLSRSRPLWECWLIEGLAGHRFALLSKLHHCLVDGVSGTALMNVLLDTGPVTRRYDPEPWIPRPAPGQIGLGIEAAADMARAPFRALRRLGGLIRSPALLVEWARNAGGGLASVARAAFAPAPRSPFNVPVGPNRIVSVARAPLDDLRLVKSVLGGTINDVVLAVTAGGLRTLLVSRGTELRTLSLRALVPVSIRSSHDESTGNRVTGILAPLPVSETDAGRRLAIIRRATRLAKQSRQGPGAELLLAAGAALPPSLARLAASAQSVQRFFNISVTNIPGPPGRLWVLGRQVQEIVPLPPLSANAALIVAAMSYAGEMSFGIVADADAVPDAGLVAEGIEKALIEMRMEAEHVR